jgi:hypothetical protein
VSVTVGHGLGLGSGGVDVKKVVGAIVVIFVLFWIISAPTQAANFVLTIFRFLEYIALSIITFLRHLF